MPEDGGVFVKLLLSFLTCWNAGLAQETYHCLPNNEVQRIQQRSGRISTVYSGENSYRDNQRCSWLIDAGTESHTKVQFRVVQNALQWTPEGSICVGYDYMHIKTGRDQYSPSQLTWCGTYNPYEFISRGPQVFIEFTSNDRQHSDGVVLDFNIFSLSGGGAQCPDGWLHFEDHCYSIQDHNETWLSAYEYCKYMGANLVTFQNDTEADFIKDEIKALVPLRTVRDYWIGLTDIETEGQYEWVDGIHSTVKLRWEKRNHNPDKYFDCVSMRSSDGKWKEQFCTESEVRTLTKLPFICKRSKSSETKVFPPPEEKIDTEGEGSIAIGKKYIVAAIVVAVILVVLIVLGVMAYRKYGSDLKRKLGNKRSPRRGDAETDAAESVPLPPYSNSARPPPSAPGFVDQGSPSATASGYRRGETRADVAPPREPSPPPPYTETDAKAPTFL